MNHRIVIPLLAAIACAFAQGTTSGTSATVPVDPNTPDFLVRAKSSDPTYYFLGGCAVLYIIVFWLRATYILYVNAGSKKDLPRRQHTAEELRRAAATLPFVTKHPLTLRGALLHNTNAVVWLMVGVGVIIYGMQPSPVPNTYWITPFGYPFITAALLCFTFIGTTNLVLDPLKMELYVTQSTMVGLIKLTMFRESMERIDGAFYEWRKEYANTKRANITWRDVFMVHIQRRDLVTRSPLEDLASGDGTRIPWELALRSGDDLLNFNKCLYEFRRNVYGKEDPVFNLDERGVPVGAPCIYSDGRPPEYPPGYGPTGSSAAINAGAGATESTPLIR